jgi:hypothetical protein
MMAGALALAFLGAALSIRAQEPPDQPKRDFPDRKLVVSPPESPAFTLLGLTPQTVARPSTPNALAVASLSSVDRFGNFQAGIAVDFQPVGLALYRSAGVLPRYKSSYLFRFANRLQTSFATTKGTSESDKATRVAGGLRFAIFDRGDPRMDSVLEKCFVGRVDALLAEPNLFGVPAATVREVEQKLRDGIENARKEVESLLKGSGATDPERPLKLSEATARLASAESRLREFLERKERGRTLEERGRAAARACRDAALKRNWNKSSWIVAAGLSGIAAPDQFQQYTWNGAGVWTSIGYGFEQVPALAKRSQLIVHGAFRNREQAPDPAARGKFRSEDSWLAGGRLRVGVPEVLVTGEVLYYRFRPAGMSWINAIRSSAGLELRIRDDLFLNFSAGGETGRPTSGKRVFLLTSMSWGFASKAQ